MNKPKYYNKSSDSGILYFKDGKQMIYLSSTYHKCHVCGRIPTTIYFEDLGFWRYYHCPTEECNLKNYKPKGLFKKLFWLYNKIWLK